MSISYIYYAGMMIYTGIYGLANMQDLTECLLRFGLAHGSLIQITISVLIITIDRLVFLLYIFIIQHVR